MRKLGLFIDIFFIIAVISMLFELTITGELPNTFVIVLICLVAIISAFENILNYFINKKEKLTN